MPCESKQDCNIVYESQNIPAWKMSTVENHEKSMKSLKNSIEQNINSNQSIKENKLNELMDQHDLTSNQ